MSKSKFLKGILLFVLSLSMMTTNAQQNKAATDQLSAQQKSLVTISSLTATGNISRLNIKLNKGLDSGLSINEIKEALVQLYAYCGFPRSLNAINTFKTVLEDRKAKGLTDNEGSRITVENKTKDKYEQGRKVLEELTKTPQAKPAPGFGEFAPRVDVFLKEHLFADIFVSNVLSYQQRELVTIAALASMPSVDGQLQSHISMGKNTGITENQLEELSQLIETNVSASQANTVRKALGKPLLPIAKADMMIRISEIEIFPEYMDEYNSILKEESSASVKIEPGVLAIFPMIQKETPTQVRIIEIYADKATYQAHLLTPHFQHYKTTTLKMVKTLKLIDMKGLDIETMGEIFKKLK
jgi:4-carboxymuconolactone decarboxylase